MYILLSMLLLHISGYVFLYVYIYIDLCIYIYCATCHFLLFLSYILSHVCIYTYNIYTATITIL